MKFKPFVGTDYQSSKLKILLLGESHYGDDENSDMTIHVAQRFSSGINYRFLSGALKAVYGKGWSRSDIQKVCFYNYLQGILPNSRAIADDTLWANSAEPFLAVLEQVAPNIVLCLGKRLYGKLPYAVNTKAPMSSEEICNDKNLWCREYEYSVKGKIVKVYAIHHPSSVGFNGLEYHKLLKPYLDSMS